MAVKFSNNAETTLSAGITNSATTISVTDGSVFPALSAGEHFYATITDGSNNEIVKVTARSSNNLTVVRGQDGTSGTAFASGDDIQLRVTAAALTDIPADYLALSGGTLTGDVDVNGVLTVANAGGTDPNFIIQGDGEQTMRFYNSASTGGKRVSWKMANRTNTDWEFIMFTDVSEDGTESFKLQGRTSGNGLLIRDGAVKSEGEFHTVGKVGIGTTSPDVNLHIAGLNPVIRLEDTNAATDAKQWNIHAGVTNILRVQALSDANIGGGSLFDFERLGTNIKQFLGRSANAGGYWFTINNNDEKVGIGTTAPDTKLHVTETGTGTYLATFQGDLGTNNNRSLRLKTPDTDSGSEPFTWQTGNAVAWQVDATEAMRLTSAGNLGIGTGSPAQKLHVVGSIRTDGNFSIQTTSNTAFTMNNTTGGNARLRFEVSGAQIYSFGVNGSNDSFTIYNANGNNTTPFLLEDGCATDSLRIQANGEVKTAGNFVAHTVEATTGGVKFPDGTTQTSAASGSATAYYYSATSTDTTTNHNSGYTPTVVDFNSELLNQGSFSETDGRITVPVAGVYRIYGQVTFTRNSTEQRMSLQLQIFKNGTSESGRARGSYVRGMGDVNDATAYIEDFVSCSANDILDIRAYRDGVSGTSILNANQSRLLIQKIG